MRTHSKLLLLILVMLALSGCAPLTKPEQPHASDLIPLTSEGSLGQTFVARYDGLQSVALYLEPETPGQGKLIMHLRSGPEETVNLRSSTLSLQDISSPGFYHFQFAPLTDSNREYYYAFVRLQGGGSLKVGAASGEAYLNGALYLNHAPQDAQAAFLLGHNRKLALVGLLGEGLTWLAWLLVSLFLYVIPGWALLCSLWPGWEALHWAEKLGLAGGVSLALYPILLLWTDLVGLHFGPLYAWLPPLVGLAVIAWRNWRLFIALPGKLRSRDISIRFSFAAIPWPDLALLFTIAMIFAVRFWVVRDLDYPMWGDSYQHTMIAQLLADNGGLFQSWEPYVPYYSLTVHFGFHTAVAIFMWLTGYSAAFSTLVAAQIINGIAILALFPLGLRLSRGNIWAGIGTVLIAGLFSSMPAFYVNWGRYAQLAGQAILPVALWLTCDILDKNHATDYKPNDKTAKSTSYLRIPQPHFILASLTIAGMTLNYYKTPFYLIFFLLAWFIGWGLPQWKFNLWKWILVFGTLALIGVFAITFALPWVSQILSSNLSESLRTGLITASEKQALLVNSTINEIRIWLSLDSYLSRPLLYITLISMIWSILRKRWEIASLVLWIISLTAFIAGRIIGIPGANNVESFAIMISVYIPASIMVGWLISEIPGRFPEQHISNGNIFLAAIIVTLAVWGSLNQRNIVQPMIFSLVSYPDNQAMDWIQNNSSPEATFLIEGFTIYDGSSAVGSDAGWWISMLAMRQNTLPPQYALVMEKPVPSDYSKRMVNLVKGLESTSLSSQEARIKLCNYGITHVYIGQRQGNVGFSARQLFAPDDLINSPDFVLRYNQDRVHIFELLPSRCQ